MLEGKFYIGRDLWLLRYQDEIKIEHDMGSVAPSYICHLSEETIAALIKWLLRR